MMRGAVGVILLLVSASACGGGSTTTPTVTLSQSPTESASPSASPTASFSAAGEIAYVGSDGGLWLMDADGANARSIYSPQSAYLYHPEWSPDGSKIAVTELDFANVVEPTDLEYGDVMSAVVVDHAGLVLYRWANAFLPTGRPMAARYPT
jgi:hypothetical protein